MNTVTSAADGPGPDSMIKLAAIGQKTSQQLPSVLLPVGTAFCSFLGTFHPPAEVKLLRVCQQDSCSHVEDGVASGRSQLIRLQILT